MRMSCWSHSLRRTLLALLVAVGTLSATVHATPAAAAPPGLEFVRAKYFVDVPGSAFFILCPGEEKRISAIVLHFDYYVDESGAQVVVNRGREPGQVLGATVANPSVGEVVPPVGVTGGPSGGATFTLTAKSPGQTDIRFTDDVHNRANPATVRVEVRDCYYRVSVTSIWRIPIRWRPTLYASMRLAEMHFTSGSGIYEGTGAVENKAVGTPVQGCVPTFTLGGTNAQLDASLIQRGRVLDVRVVAEPVSVVTAVACPGGSAGKTDGGSPGVLTFKGPASGGSRTVSQRFFGVGVVSGPAYVNVVRVVR